jgi:predicted HNH restriction endonuclease
MIIFPYLGPFGLGRLQQVSHRFQENIVVFLKMNRVLRMNYDETPKPWFSKRYAQWRRAFRFLTKDATRLKHIDLQKCVWLNMKDL